MSQQIDIESIWWRNVQPGEFYNIERYHQIRGGGGIPDGDLTHGAPTYECIHRED